MTGHITFITPIYAGFFGILLVMLSKRVTRLRRQYENNNKMRESGHNELNAAVRARDNIVEYVPYALLLMWMLETMQFGPRLIHACGILLVVARLAHLHGLSQPGGDGLGRRLGNNLTWLHIILCSLLCFAGAFGLLV
ncbi:MAG: MAPEG family protein [Alphaproteobacteria bacterium]|nr:MAPEG family protein [Alphaproteobacteria bacterium]